MVVEGVPVYFPVLKTDVCMNRELRFCNNHNINMFVCVFFFERLGQLDHRYRVDIIDSEKKEHMHGNRVEQNNKDHKNGIAKGSKALNIRPKVKNRKICSFFSKQVSVMAAKPTW